MALQAVRNTTITMLLVFAAVVTHAQVSLATVVDLAQRNSTGVRAAQADLNKANAVLSESKDAVIPSISFGTGLPVFPEVGFTGSPPSIWSATVQSLVYSFPRWLAAVRESLPEGTPVPNLADVIQEKCEKLLEQVCMPVQG